MSLENVCLSIKLSTNGLEVFLKQKRFFYVVGYAAKHGHVISLFYVANHSHDITSNRDDSMTQAANHGHVMSLFYVANHSYDIKSNRDESMIQAAKHGHVITITAEKIRCSTLLRHH